MLVAQFLSVTDLHLPCKCLNIQVGGRMWVSKSWKCCPKLLDILALESNYALWKDLLSIDHTQQESFLEMGHFSKNLMAFYLSKVPKLVPLKMHLSKWCKQCCEITVKWDAVTDALLNPKKQIDSPFIDSVISPWLSSLELWVDGFILLCLKHRAMEKILTFFFASWKYWQCNYKDPLLCAWRLVFIFPFLLCILFWDIYWSCFVHACFLSCREVSHGLPGYRLALLSWSTCVDPPLLIRIWYNPRLGNKTAHLDGFCEVFEHRT